MTGIPSFGDPVSAQIALIMAENDRLRNLLNVERVTHRETRRKLEKADHDRKRYARRIRFLDGRHSALCAHYRALQAENKILNGCVTTLERRLLDGTCREAEGGTPQTSGGQEKTAEAARQLERDTKQNGIYNAETALSNPYYMTQITQKRLEQRKAMEKNGITQADLKAEYEKGYAAARRDLAIFTMRMFYSAIGISLHRLFKFGETRILRVLDDVQWIMTEEICTDDIIARCKSETGIDICNGDYDS